MRGRSLVRVVVKVENRGEVLLQLGRTIVRLHQVLPVSEELSAQIPVAGSVSPTERAPLELRPFYEQTTDWEMLGGELEPGELDELEFHFVVPLETQTVMVYSFLGNKRKVRRPMPTAWADLRQYITNTQTRNRDFGWIKTSIHEI